MWNDPIVEEVCAVRDAHAKKLNYDLKSIAADLRKQQQANQHKVVSLPARIVTVMPVVKASKKN